MDNNGEILPKAIETKDPSILQTADQKGRYERAMKFIDGSDINMWGSADFGAERSGIA